MQVHRLITSSLGLALALAVSGCIAAEAPDENQLADEALQPPNCAMKSNRLGGYDSGVAFASFWTGAAGFTISGWIMPEYMYADDMPIFGSAAGGFWIGQGDFRVRQRNTMDCSGDYVPVLTFHLRSQTVSYLAPTLTRGQWSHLALVWSPGPDKTATVRPYLDGVELLPHRDATIGAIATCGSTFDVQSSAAVLTPADNASPSGSLQVGTAGVSPFYGLLDSVLVQNVALSATQVAALAAGGAPAAGTTVWSQSFNAPSCTGAIGTGTARRVYIGARDAADAALFSDPALVSPTPSTFHLPFAPGEIWRVVQEFDSPGSHNGYAAFCWDFGKVGGSSLATVRSATAGTMVHVLETDDPAPDVLEDNYVLVETPTLETTSHRHIEHDSVTDVFFGAPGPMFLPDQHNFTVAVASEDPIAKVGAGTRAHLHFGLRPTWNAGTTIPMAFSNYQVAIDCATGAEITAQTANIASWPCWKTVSRGMPRNDTYLRRP